MARKNQYLCRNVTKENNPVIHYYITPQHISIYCMSEHYIIMCKAIIKYYSSHLP